MAIRSILLCVYLVPCPFLLAQESPPADTPPPLEAAETEIRAAVDAYVEAFNRQDVEALGQMWTSDGVYTMRSDGRRILGRDSIREIFQEVIGEEKKSSPKLAVESTSIEFVSPRVALERGNAIVTYDESDVSESIYTAVYVKEQGKWLIDRITEEEIVVAASHYENLKGLEWMIGEWVDDGEDYSIELECDWTTNQNYISRLYQVSGPDGFESSGLQIIGWDAKQKQIRSWLFDSDGGFVSGTWIPRDDEWVVQSVVTLADGASGSFTSIFKPQEDGICIWQKVNRVLDGKLLPNIDEVVIRRK